MTKGGSIKVEAFIFMVLLLINKEFCWDARDDYWARQLSWEKVKMKIYRKSQSKKDDDSDRFIIRFNRFIIICFRHLFLPILPFSFGRSRESIICKLKAIRERSFKGFSYKLEESTYWIYLCWLDSCWVFDCFQCGSWL